MTSSFRSARADRALGASPVAPPAADHRVAPRTARLPRSGASFDTLAPAIFCLAGKYRFRLKAGNGQVVATSEACETKAAAKKGCESVQRAADEATVGEVET